MRSIILWLLLLPAHSIAQEHAGKFEQQLEEWAERNETEELEDDELIQLLEAYRKRPLDLNRSGEEELKNFPLLNPLLVQQLIQYRKLLGPLVSIYELQAVPGFDLRVIENILPYITIRSSQGLEKILTNSNVPGNHQLLLRWALTFEKARGYASESGSGFSGNRHQWLLRYRYAGKDLYYGILGEKDAGEAFFRGAQVAGFDFYSAHLFIKNVGRVRSLALGDFVVNLGQGLIHYQSAGSGKGMQVMNAKRQAPVLMPYRSAGEFNFLRGAGVEMGFGKWSLVSFASYRKLSASMSDSAEIFTGFSSAGLHRTSRETAGRNQLGLFTAGGQLSRKGRAGKISFNSVYYNYGKVFRKRELPYNYFSPSGKEFLFLGSDYSLTVKNMHFYGEAAMNRSGQKAIAGGLVMSLDAKADLALHYRKISKQYHAWFGNAFTENTFPSNEEGFYAGIVLRPFKGFTINAFADVFHFPWLRYRVDAPTNGNEFLFGIDYQASRSSSIQLIYKSKTRSLNNLADHFNFPESRLRQSLRLHFASQVSKNFQMRARTELVNYSRPFLPVDQGFMLYLDVLYRPGKFQSAVRLQWFETGSYESRIYSYEPDVLYSSLIVPVYDAGRRVTTNFRYSFSKNLSFSMKLSRHILNNKTAIGSSYMTIDDNHKTDGKFQIVWNF